LLFKHRQDLQDLKDSLFIAKEFFDAKKLRTLQGAKINSSRRAGVEQIFAWKRVSRPRFLAKIPNALHKLSFKSQSTQGRHSVVAQKGIAKLCQR
jgi:hypothetical protein